MTIGIFEIYDATQEGCEIIIHKQTGYAAPIVGDAIGPVFKSLTDCYDFWVDTECGKKLYQSPFEPTGKIGGALHRAFTFLYNIQAEAIA